jgi:hypothetical protein
MKQHTKIKSWITIIALLALACSLVNICFYILIRFGVIEETLSKFDTFELFFGTLAGLTIFIGLWLFEPWGWKAAVLLIPISWVIGCYGLITGYFRGLAIGTSLFVILDAAILRYLFKPKVMNFFKIFSTPLFKLKWTWKGLFLLALYLIVIDLFGNLVAIITVLAIFLGIKTAKKYMEKLRTSKDLTNG